MNEETLEGVRQDVINTINAFVSSLYEKPKEVEIRSNIKSVLKTICDAYKKLDIYDPYQEHADMEENDSSVLQEDTKNRHMVNINGHFVSDINTKCEQFLIDELQYILNHIK